MGGLSLFSKHKVAEEAFYRKILHSSEMLFLKKEKRNILRKDSRRHMQQTGVHILEFEAWSRAGMFNSHSSQKQKEEASVSWIHTEDLQQDSRR